MLSNTIKTGARHVVPLLAILFMSGCALQSSLVDIEQGMERGEKKTQHIEDDLNVLRAQVDKQAKEVKAEVKAIRAEKQPVNNNQDQKGTAELLEQIEGLNEQLRRLEGRIEEEGRKSSEAMRATDDQAHQVDLLESRVSSLEKGLPPGKSSAGESTKTPGVTSVPLVSPTEAYALAYNDYLRGNDDLAILGFQNYLKEYPNATQVPQAIYWTGQAYYNKAAYADAVSFFEQIESRFPEHDIAPNAMFKKGLSYIKLSKQDLAKETLQKVIDRFPQSDEARLAKDKLESLR